MHAYKVDNVVKFPPPPAPAATAAPSDDDGDWELIARIGAGEFKGAADAQAGQWELIVDLYRGDDRVFRSRSKVILK